MTTSRRPSHASKVAIALLVGAVLTFDLAAPAAEGKSGDLRSGSSTMVRPSPTVKRWDRRRLSTVHATNDAHPVGVSAAGTLSDETFNSCRKVPTGKRTEKVSLKPDTDLVALIVWISSITCKPFILSGAIATRSKRVTIVAPAFISPAEAYRLFLNALDSIGLTVKPSGTFLKIIESAKARSSPIPVYDWDGHRFR